MIPQILCHRVHSDESIVVLSEMADEEVMEKHISQLQLLIPFAKRRRHVDVDRGSRLGPALGRFPSAGTLFAWRCIKIKILIVCLPSHAH